MTLEDMFLLPRLTRTKVAPHLFRFKLPIVLPSSTGGSSGSIILRPSLQEFLQVSSASDNASSLFRIDQVVDYSWQSKNQGTGITIDTNLPTPKGLIKTSTSPQAGYTHFGSASLTSGAKYYPGIYSFSDSDLQIDFVNSDQGVLDLTIIFRAITAAGNTITGEVNANYATLAHGASSKTILATDLADFYAAAAQADAAGIQIVIKINNANDRGNIPQGFTVDIGADSVAPTFSVAQATKWTTRIFFALQPENETVLRAQFDMAERVCVTALEATLTNTSSQLVRGGDIWAAQMPGNSEHRIPGTTEGIQSMLGTRDYNSYSGNNLDKGVHWNYRFEKIQDSFFERPYQPNEIDPDSNPHNLPYLIISFKTPPVDVSAPGTSLVLSGSVMVEYLTTDVSSPHISSPADAMRLLEVLVSEMSNHPCLHENPTHLQNAARIAKSVATSSTVRALAKMAISAGVQLAPTVLSLL